MTGRSADRGDQVGHYCDIHDEEWPKRDWCPLCELEYERMETTA